MSLADLRAHGRYPPEIGDFEGIGKLKGLLSFALCLLTGFLVMHDVEGLLTAAETAGYLPTLAALVLSLILLPGGFAVGFWCGWAIALQAFWTPREVGE